MNGSPNSVPATVASDTHAHSEAACLHSRRALAGELALVPPLLGSSQTLLNRNHWAVYYEVCALRLH